VPGNYSTNVLRDLGTSKRIAGVDTPWGVFRRSECREWNGDWDIETNEAYSRDCERSAFAMRCYARRLDVDATDAAAIGEADESAGLLNDAGEHGFILRERRARNSEQWTEMEAHL
jgi:hypothetical protein